MNIEEIGIEQKHPSSVGKTLKRCDFEFNTVKNAAMSFETLAGLLDPISKNFRTKNSNQEEWNEIV